VDALPGLKEAAPQARVLMLTVSEDEQDLATALQRGAQGYLLKTVDGDVLAQSVRRTVRGESVVSPEMTSKLVTAFQARSLPAAPEPPPAAPAPADPLAALCTPPGTPGDPLFAVWAAREPRDLSDDATTPAGAS